MCPLLLRPSLPSAFGTETRKTTQLVAAAIAAFLFSLANDNTGVSAKRPVEITWQDFTTLLLESGKVGVRVCTTVLRCFRRSRFSVAHRKTAAFETLVSTRACTIMSDVALCVPWRAVSGGLVTVTVPSTFVCPRDVCLVSSFSLPWRSGVVMGQRHVPVQSAPAIFVFGC